MLCSFKRKCQQRVGWQPVSRRPFQQSRGHSLETIYKGSYLREVNSRLSSNSEDRRVNSLAITSHLEWALQSWKDMAIPVGVLFAWLQWGSWECEMPLFTLYCLLAQGDISEFRPWFAYLWSGQNDSELPNKTDVRIESTGHTLYSDWFTGLSWVLWLFIFLFFLLLFLLYFPFLFPPFSSLLPLPLFKDLKD